MASSLDLSALPDEIKSARRFLFWREEQPDTLGGKPRKVPCYIHGAKRGTYGDNENIPLDTPKDLIQLATFDDALLLFNPNIYAGLGFALGKDGDTYWQGIDLDGLASRPQLDALVPTLPSYVETSPSRNGVHALGRGSWFDNMGSNESGIEAYSEKRYFTITGHVIKSEPLTDVSDFIRDTLRPLHGSVGREAPPISDGLMDYTPPHGVAPNEVRALLDQLNPDMGRDPWLKVGMALHHEFSGSLEGFEYWDEWSRGGLKYGVGQSTEAVWDSFKSEGRVITMGTIKKMVADSVVDLDTPEIAPDQSLKLKATEWVVPGFMSTGLTVIAGRAGGGKTSSLVSMFAQVAHLCAPDAMLRPTLRRHIAYMAEDVEQVKRCLYGLLKHGESGLTEQEFLDWFHIIPSRRVSAQALANTIKKCNEQYSYTLPNGFVVKPVLIADTANATLDLENENDNSEVGRAVAILKQALDGMALVVVAHTAKSLVRADLSEMSPRGASAWIGDANATIYAFEDVKLPKARFLGLGKHRFEPEMGEIGFESTVYHEHVYAAWGESQVVKYRVSTPMRSSAEVREQAREAAHDEAEVARFAKQRTAVFDALNALGAGEYLTKNELVKVMSGRNELRGADLDALIEDEFILKITPSEGGYARRNNAHKEGLVLSDAARAQAWTGGEDELV
jgi:hypothetical protein